MRSGGFLGVLSAVVSVAGLYAADAPLPVVRVCEILRDLHSYRGKVFAVVGRFSYRDAGRFLSEKICDSTKSEGHPDPAAILVLYDSKLAPRPPHDLYFDRSHIDKELEVIRRQTSLASFRSAPKTTIVGPWFTDALK